MTYLVIETKRERLGVQSTYYASMTLLFPFSQREIYCYTYGLINGKSRENPSPLSICRSRMIGLASGGNSGFRGTLDERHCALSDYRISKD